MTTGRRPAESASNDTALRDWPRQHLSEIGWADIVLGIPCFNSEATIAHVMRTAAEGLSRYYPRRQLVVIVSDGGSTDLTRETAQKTRLSRGVHRLVTIYRGIPGKGTSLRCIFEAALLLEARACVVVDSDLRSITPEWIRALASPVLDHGYDFVSPYYVRHKYDATITNNIARSLTQALYGRRLRQPIGGEFGLSPRLLSVLTGQQVWNTDVARFGIDIWMTTIAICEGMKICETALGAKVHDPKDPAASLAPMFRQVVGTLFEMMIRYERVWRLVRGSEAVPLLGDPITVEPEAVNVSVAALIGKFRTGIEHFGGVWQGILGAERYEQLKALAARDPAQFDFPMDLWARVVYDFAVAYPRWAGERQQLVEMLIPIYFARVAGFVNQARDLGPEDAERLVEEQAKRFEDLKDEFARRWESR